jgi:hypothetical protein
MNLWLARSCFVRYHGCYERQAAYAIAGRRWPALSADAIRDEDSNRSRLTHASMRTVSRNTSCACRLQLAPAERYLQLPSAKTNFSPLDGGDAVSPKSHFAKRTHLPRHPEALARQSRASLEGRTAWQLRNRAASFEALASLGHLRMTADDGGCVRQDKPAQVTFGKTKSRVGSMSYEARSIEVTFRKTNCGAIADRCRCGGCGSGVAFRKTGSGDRCRVWPRGRISQNGSGMMPSVAGCGSGVAFSKTSPGGSMPSVAVCRSGVAFRKRAVSVGPAQISITRAKETRANL